MSLRALLVCVPVVLSVSACGGDGGSGADVPLRILIVNEHGDPVLARHVLYQPQPGDAFWLGAEAATCETGEPPCSEWVIEDSFAERGLPQRHVHRSPQSVLPAGVARL